MLRHQSGPPRGALHDVVEETAEVVVEETGELLQLPALLIIVRRSTTNAHGRTKDEVRIVAQDDETCPVAAWRAPQPHLQFRPLVGMMKHSPRRRP